MNFAPFDIRNFADRLAPVDRAKNRYFCPVCEGNNFTIDPNSTKYQCWNGCELRDIREALSPWEDRQSQSTPPKAIRPNNDRTWTYTDADGNELIRTRRIDNGEGDRKIWQEYKNDRGEWLSKAPEPLKQQAKTLIKPYRYLEVMQAIERGETVFWVEGEPCADSLWSLGIPATTTIGGSGGYNRGSYKNLFPENQLVVCPDCDQTGIKYGNQIASDC